MGRVGSGCQRKHDRGVFAAGRQRKGPDARRARGEGVGVARGGTPIVVGCHDSAGGVVDADLRIGECGGHPKLRQAGAHAAHEQIFIRRSGDYKSADERAVGRAEGAAAGDVGEARGGAAGDVVDFSERDATVGAVGVGDLDRVGTGGERDQNRGVGAAGRERESTAGGGGLAESGTGPTVVFDQNIAGGIHDPEQRGGECAGDSEAGEARADGADEHGAVTGAVDGETGEEIVAGRDAGAGREIGEASERGRAGRRRELRGGDGLRESGGVRDDAESDDGRTAGGGRNAGAGRHHGNDRPRRKSRNLHAWSGRNLRRQDIREVDLCDGLREARGSATTARDYSAGAEVEITARGLGGERSRPSAGCGDASRVDR